MNREEAVDIWKLLETSMSSDANAVSTTNKKTDEEIAKSKRRVKKFFLFADTVSVLFWAYIFTQFFLFNLDQYLTTILPEPFSSLLTYKYLIFVGACLLVGIFFWRWLTLGLLFYVILFPILAIVWRLPRLFYKAQGWLGVMGFVNAFGLFFKNFRYNAISKGIAVIAATYIIFSGSTPVLMLSALALLVVLIWSSVRTVRLTVRPNWFLEVHQKIIKRTIASQFVRHIITLDENIQTGGVRQLDATQADNLTNNIQFAIIATKSLHFWAYQLKQYRERYISLLFNVSTFFWLLIGGVLVFWLINVAIYKIDPVQYEVLGDYNNLKMFVYGFSNLFFNDGGGITGVGNAALVIRILAGLFGSLFLLTLVFNIGMTIRQTRDDKALNRIIRDLKHQAQELDTDFQGTFLVSPDEAVLRMSQMKRGMYSFLVLLSSLVPKDFLSIDDEG